MRLRVGDAPVLDASSTTIMSIRVYHRAPPAKLELLGFSAGRPVSYRRTIRQVVCVSDPHRASGGPQRGSLACGRSSPSLLADKLKC
jgi:hypothetical protein